MAATASQEDLQAEIDRLRRQLSFSVARDALLAKIDDAIRSETDADKITLAAATLLGQHLKVNRCAYADIEPDKDTFNLHGDYTNGVQSIVGRYTLAQFSIACRDALRHGEPFVVQDSETDPRVADVRDNFRAAEIRSVICVGLLKRGIFTLAMAVHCKTPRVWLPEEIELVTAVALRCWESVERSRLLRQLQDEREALLGKTTEAEQQRAEIETIYRTAPIGLALFDLDGYHYLRLNDRQAAFFGLKPEQILGRRVTEMAPIEGLKELFDQVARGEPVINFPLEGTLVTDPTDYRYWTVSYFPVYGADGNIQAITAASLEVTAQKKAELALLQSEKLAIVGRLASSIAHEINNPLESITNLLYLAENSATFEQSRHYIQTAEIELRRVSAITSQTLRFHKQSTSPQEMNITELLRSVLSIYQGRIANAYIQIDRDSRAKRRVRCFEGEIRQVVANIISNALDAMPAGGRLCIRDREATNWRTGEQGIVVTVSDTGVGMSPETRKRVFNPFFTTKGLTGTGLGLWVTKEIVDRHRGTLSVRSSQSPIRHGTVFTLFLPFDAAVR
jgi:C4-dicarboxylate-specific signal transduction histidine kinase